MYLFAPCASQVAGRAAHSGSRCSRTFSASLCPSSKTRKAPPTARRCLRLSAQVSTRRYAKRVGRSFVRFVCWSRGKKSASYTRRDIVYTSGFILQFGECEIGQGEPRMTRMDPSSPCHPCPPRLFLHVHHLDVITP